MYPTCRVYGCMLCIALLTAAFLYLQSPTVPNVQLKVDVRYTQKQVVKIWLIVFVYAKPPPSCGTSCSHVQPTRLCVYVCSSGSSRPWKALGQVVKVAKGSSADLARFQASA